MIAIERFVDKKFTICDVFWRYIGEFSTFFQKIIFQAFHKSYKVLVADIKRMSASVLFTLEARLAVPIFPVFLHFSSSSLLHKNVT